MNRKLIGPPHAHLDAPCTDDCYMYEGHPRQLTDGHHTMEELYNHRRALTAALFAERADVSWKSKQHHPDDDPMFPGGWFVVGMDTPAGMISYHYKLAHWDDFVLIPELPHAPKWDGASPSDTVTRLLDWARDEPFARETCTCGSDVGHEYADHTT